jgi:hypothetical protein
MARADIRARVALGQRFFRDEAPARRVDQEAPLLHLAEGGRVEREMGLGRRGGVEGDHVRGRQQLLEGDALRLELGHDISGSWTSIAVRDPHAESPGATSDGRPDSSHAEDAQGGPPQLQSGHPGKRPDAPPAAPHQRIGLHYAAADRQQQRHGEVRGGIGEHAGGVTHQNPLVGGRA